MSSIPTGFSIKLYYGSHSKFKIKNVFFLNSYSIGTQLYYHSSIEGTHIFKTQNYNKIDWGVQYIRYFNSFEHWW